MELVGKEERKMSDTQCNFEINLILQLAFQRHLRVQKGIDHPQKKQRQRAAVWTDPRQYPQKHCEDTKRSPGKIRLTLFLLSLFLLVLHLHVSHRQLHVARKTKMTNHLTDPGCSATFTTSALLSCSIYTQRQQNHLFNVGSTTWIGVTASEKMHRKVAQHSDTLQRMKQPRDASIENILASHF